MSFFLVGAVLPHLFQSIRKKEAIDINSQAYLVTPPAKADLHTSFTLLGCVISILFSYHFLIKVSCNNTQVHNDCLCKYLLKKKKITLLYWHQEELEFIKIAFLNEACQNWTCCLAARMRPYFIDISFQFLDQKFWHLSVLSKGRYHQSCAFLNKIRWKYPKGRINRINRKIQISNHGCKQIIAVCANSFYEESALIQAQFLWLHLLQHTANCIAVCHILNRRANWVYNHSHLLKILQHCPAER